MQIHTVLLTFLTALVYAQAQPFDVASIREVVTGVRELETFEASGARVEYRGYSVLALIAEAWNLRGDEVVLGPGVSRAFNSMMAAGRSAGIYNIAALAPNDAGPTRDESRLLLRSLLSTRFKLVFHREPREKAIYTLTVNGASKLKPNLSDGTCRVNASRTPEGQKLVATHCPMRTLIGNLFVDRPIYDETGLTSFYDFEITAALPFQSSDPAALSPFTAVRELGLKLEEARRSIDTIVIDSVEPPSEN
jgi:uncharacterized protein (TIGR03435 family)